MAIRRSSTTVKLPNQALNQPTHVLIRALCFLAIAIIAVETSLALEAVVEDQVGSICLAPIKGDSDPRGYYSEHFRVRIDDQRWIPMPSATPTLIPEIPLKKEHLVSIRDGDETIESFRFSFEEFESPDLCLWYKPWYRTWSLWNAADGGQKCRCISDDKWAG